MRRRDVLLPLLTALALSATACGKSATGPNASRSLSGFWSGTSQGLTLNLTLTEGTSGAVSGSGNLAGGTENFALIVRQGTHVQKNVTLTLGATGYEDMNLTAQVTSATTMTGTLNGSGFDNFNLNLVKK